MQHRHRNAGNFQFWRKGRWITRESAGYSKPLVAFGGNGTIDTEHHVAHNGLLFQGRTTGRWVGTGPIVIPPGDDRGDHRDAPAEHADDGQHEADEGDRAGGAAGEHELVSPALAAPP